jgi:hypothetical protein
LEAYRWKSGSNCNRKPLYYIAFDALTRHH